VGEGSDSERMVFLAVNPRGEESKTFFRVLEEFQNKVGKKTQVLTSSVTRLNIKEETRRMTLISEGNIQLRESVGEP